MSSRPAWATPAQPGLKTPQGKAKLVGKNTSFEEQNSPFQGSQDPGPSRPVALAAFCLPPSPQLLRLSSVCFSLRYLLCPSLLNSEEPRGDQFPFHAVMT